MMINLSIADNQPVVMHGIKSYFKSHSEISVLDTFNHLRELELSLDARKAGVLLIDLELEGLHSIKSLKKMVEEHPKTKILVYTSASEKLFGVTSLKAGASGFISKKETLLKVEQAILQIAEGKTYFSDLVHKSVISSARMNNEERMYRKLSSREKEVLSYLINGKKNNEISELLNLNEKTISTYKLRLLNKLNVTNLIDLVNKAKTLEIV
ncbi:LuxR C-terminal-related transcriptional regulator [Flavobacterium tegetincola]|uniref:LuxR C-terminal-related transcriptional regulator n=1 Tax=Flavobacterium tegetincola TaxID=150172 RepID=UPI0004113ABA|nr:response regulator transcription factor [Flavobacterium tegetincola]